MAKRKVIKTEYVLKSPSGLNAIMTFDDPELAKTAKGTSQFRLIKRVTTEEEIELSG